MTTSSTPAYWDSMVERFDSIYSRGMLDRIFRRDIFERIDYTVGLIDWLGKELSVLDVGTGTGRLCVPLAKRGHSVVGTDFSSKMLEKARAVAASAGVSDRCQFVQVSDNEIPDGKFDAVAVLGVMDYIADPLPLLHTIKKADPLVILVAYPRAGTVRSAIRKRRYRMQGLDCPLYFYTPEQVHEMGRAIGSHFVEQRIMGQLHYAAYWLNAGTNGRGPWQFSMAWDDHGPASLQAPLL